MGFSDIQRHNVSERRILLADQEAHDFRAICRNQAFRAGLCQVIAQHRFRIGDSRRKARLVELEDRREITRLVLANGCAHAADSMSLDAFCGKYLRRPRENSASLDVPSDTA